ncbi:MAG: GNAT family N-acetyltransferase [Acidobacteria bacterium]|nr:GNAT family N-acetyltransferase [Acidobacteriota bacterium]
MTTIGQRPIELFAVTPHDWKQFEPTILQLERENFAPGLREQPADLRALIESATSIVIGVRTEDGVLGGYIASDVLERFGDVPGIQDDPHWGHRDTHYIASVVVRPSLRHRGIATALTRQCVRAACQRGFRRVTAHMEAGAARKIDDRTRALGSYPDWYGTGRVFEYIVLPLSVAG